MRLLIFLLLCSGLHSQSTFIHLDSICRFPESAYDSLSRYTTLLIGEQHGTAEAPLLVGSVANTFIRHNRRVTLALEIPTENQADLSLFLKTGDKSILKRLPFFKGTKDGRSSVAMVNLIEACYKKENLSILCFDVNEYVGSDGARDSAMAQTILKAKQQNPGSVVISLSGNIHANIKKGFRKGYETMGYHLKEALGRELLSLDIRYKTGSAYNCKKDGCRERSLPEDMSHYKDYLKKEGYLFFKQ